MISGLSVCRFHVKQATELFEYVKTKLGNDHPANDALNAIRHIRPSQ